jgi:hypothetical protein
MADYYSVIARAVSRLPSKTDEARHGIYERARTALRETLNNYDPALSGCSRNGHFQIGSRLIIQRYAASPKRGNRKISAFLAGLLALIRTERIYPPPAASVITGALP